jgi:hypothetical protein
LSEADIRLSKRLWLLRNFQKVMMEAEYHRSHKDMFKEPKLVFWGREQEEGSVEVTVRP